MPGPDEDDPRGPDDDPAGTVPDHLPFDLFREAVAGAVGDADDHFGLGDASIRPLPPEDRLWRHPSELASTGLPAASTPPPRSRTRRRPESSPPTHRPTGITMGQRLVAVGLAGGVGALLTAGVLVATGQMSSVETVAEMPTVTSSAVVDRGASLVDHDGAAAVVARVQPSVMALSATKATGPLTRGSATLVQPGYAITSLRVVDGATALTLHVGGAPHTARLVGSDPETDLALLAVDGLSVEPAALGRSSSLRPGDTAVSVMAPPGATGTHSVTVGVVSALDRTMIAGKMVVRGALQLDRPVPAEGGGGALVDVDGNVIGITLAAPDMATQFGYAIPIDAVTEVSRQLLMTGHMSRPWLGIEGGDDDDGASVWQIKPGSPAARAGVQIGDIVLAMDEHQVDSMDGMIRMLRAHAAGDTVHLHLKRKDTVLDLAVTLAER